MKVLSKRGLRSRLAVAWAIPIQIFPTLMIVNAPSGDVSMLAECSKIFS